MSASEREREIKLNGAMRGSMCCRNGKQSKEDPDVKDANNEKEEIQLPLVSHMASQVGMYVFVARKTCETCCVGLLLGVLGSLNKGNFRHMIL